MKSTESSGSESLSREPAPAPAAAQPSVGPAAVQREDVTLTQTLDLVRQGKQGDRAATEKLFARYHDVIRRIVILRTGANLKAREDFEDIVQEAMLDVFKALDRFEYRSHREFVGWLARITVNRIRAMANQHNALKRGGDEDIVFLAQLKSNQSSSAEVQLPADQSGPSTVVNRRHEFDHVMECALELPEKDRELLAQFLIHGEDWATIGQELGLKNDAARMRWARIRTKLASLSIKRR